MACRFFLGVFLCLVMPLRATIVVSPQCEHILRLAEKGQADDLKLFLEQRVQSMHLNETVACLGPIKRQPLHFAALQGRTNAINVLLDHGADVDARERYGVSSLMYAAMKGHVDAIRLLVQRGAEINAKNHNKWTPLHYAARHGRLEAVELLMELGSDIHAVQNQKFTPYKLAMFFNTTSAVRRLEELGAAVE
eukprot:TRINITY_DN23866_c0_g1_i1.p1 TRINITY_DN23866_c0_g1~~TRINITY_DN23866_c0_g1_i1.p1  ORF type:complete len:193 (+),score=31.86 TRINITY_DN23866_c0_g1_i1:102-680(+)